MEILSEFKSGNEDIAVVLLKTKESRHCGIIFKDKEDSNNIKLFHYAFHLRLSIDNNFTHYLNAIAIYPCFFDSSFLLSKIKYNNFFLLMKNIHESNEYKIPYSTINDGKSKMFLNGNIEHSKGIVGFTCATFLESFLRSHLSKQLINFKSWKITPQDKVWQKEVFKMLLKATEGNEGDVTFINSIRDVIQHDLKSKLTPRLKPEELVAAAEMDCTKHPANHTSCQVDGELLLSELNDF